MIKGSKLLLDKNCPMCHIYGKCFEKTGLIDEDTIIYYQVVDEEVFEKVDPVKAKSEVAFFNERTGKTYYGVKAFLHILSHNNKFLKWFLNTSIMFFIAEKTYRFISYNRQVMAGRYIDPSERDCSPSYRLSYRLSYIILIALSTGLILNHFTFILDAGEGKFYNPYTEYIVAFGQIAWQFIAIQFINKKKRLDYLGNMSTVSFVGGLLLLPLFVFNALGALNPFQLLLYFSIVVFAMFIMHIKRTKNLGLPFSITVSWLVYRLIALGTILLLTI